MKKKERISLVVFIIILILIVIVLVFGKNNSDDKPTYDIDGDLLEEVNSSISSIYDLAERNNYSIKYQDYNNKEILSIFLQMDRVDETYGHTTSQYFSYNIDKKTKRVLENDEIALYFNTTIEEIEKIILDRMKLYYDEESIEGYVEKNECDFNCYLSFYRAIDINNLKNNYSLMIENNKLYIYICFDWNSLNEDIDYFKNLDYNPNKIEF